MPKLKELANEASLDVSTICPYPDKELEQMDKDYKALSPIDFGKKYRYLIFSPSHLVEQSKSFPIQMNYCNNPFCKWFGMPQQKFENVKSKPSRYKIVGVRSGVSRGLACNEDVVKDTEGISMNCITESVSNWSIAEEIKRLITINAVVDKEEEYIFHKDGCSDFDKNPFDNKKAFYSRGKSTGNSQKYQCKTCKKITNVLPTARENFSYNQNKNDVLPLFTELLVSRTPVKRTCEILDISPKTYYHKLEWLYRKCLEFLEKYETKAFKNKEFDKIWLNTDKMIYYLNNVRRKGKGGLHYDIEDTKFQTFLVASSELYSRYVFRADIAYDFNITQEQIEADTIKYHDDHLYGFARKNERLRFPYAPQPPTPNDDETKSEYELRLSEFNRRKDYIEGMHTNSKYTSVAHYWLIKEMINCNKWNFISDEDSSLIDALMRVFTQSIKDKQSHYFLCKLDRSLTKREAYNLFTEAMRELKKWVKDNGKKGLSSFEIQKQMIAEVLDYHSLYDYVVKDGKRYPKWGKNPIEHPLPSIDEGVRYVDCITDLADKSSNEVADYLARVNSHSINAFFNQIRRSISILERPLVTARGEGKSYIYSNYNPKYAQYAITILRTFYNFCWAFKSGNGDVLTPAQRIGITDKQFNYNDIIYFS